MYYISLGTWWPAKATGAPITEAECDEILAKLEVPSGFPGDLRDWFAGQALSAIVTGSKVNDEKTARFAYDLADAMIAEKRRRT